MTIAVSLPTRSIDSKSRAPLSDIDMVGSQAKARPPPSSSGAPAEAKGGKGKGRRTSDRSGVQEGVTVGNAEKERERKRKAGEFFWPLVWCFARVGLEEDVERKERKGGD